MEYLIVHTMISVPNSKATNAQLVRNCKNDIVDDDDVEKDFLDNFTITLFNFFF